MWRNTIYDMPEWVSRGLREGTIDRIEYSEDHSEDTVVMADGSKVIVDMRREPTGVRGE